MKVVQEKLGHESAPLAFGLAMRLKALADFIQHLRARFHGKGWFTELTI